MRETFLPLLTLSITIPNNIPMTMPKGWIRNSGKKLPKKEAKNNIERVMVEVSKAGVARHSVSPRKELTNVPKGVIEEYFKHTTHAVPPRSEYGDLAPIILEAIAKLKNAKQEATKQEATKQDINANPTAAVSQFEDLPKTLADECIRRGLVSIFSEIPRKNFADLLKSDKLTEIIKEITLQVSRSQGKHEATRILSKTLIGYSELMDEKKLQVAILEALSAKNEEKLTTIIETTFGKNLGGNFWQKMDKQFYDILRESKHGFKINTAINIILVITGGALISNAIAYSWLEPTNALNAWSIFSGGIGMAALVTLFFYKSQNAITKAIANLSVVDMIFKSHYRAYESVTDYDYRADSGTAVRNLQDLKSMIEILEKTTRRHVKLMQGLQLAEENNGVGNNDDEKKVENGNGNDKNVSPKK
jgi:hypothetical protein